MVFQSTRPHGARLKKWVKKQCNKANSVRASVGTALATGISQAQAAIDISGVQTGITGAQTAAENVGGMIIVAVAGLMAVGLILVLMKKA